MAKALRANPLTAPYPINATWRDGAVVLSGRVGTKQVHDAAVQMAIAFGFPFRDDLVIDTAETIRVAMSSTPSMTGYGALAPNLSASYYVYPQPLFGWLDDPFFGMEPPVVSFPPWWRRQMRRPDGRPERRRAADSEPGRPECAAGRRRTRARRPGCRPNRAEPRPAGAGKPGRPGPPGTMELPPAKGDIEITVDAIGQVFLRGVVASEEVAREIEQTAWSVPGVSRVVTQLQVKPRPAESAGHREPPPPPQPVSVQPDGPMVPPQVEAGRVEASDRDAPPPGSPRSRADARGAAAAGAASGRASSRPTRPDGRRGPRRPALTRRVIDCPPDAARPGRPAIKVRTTGDAVMLSGKVPSAYEAMMAYRSAQQTPGVRDVVDRLEFLVPGRGPSQPSGAEGPPRRTSSPT